jgi:DNA invertase Pin-like site-specific DNA recombinase
MSNVTRLPLDPKTVHVDVDIPVSQRYEFERDILRDRVKAGIAEAREDGRPHVKSPTVRKYAAEIVTVFPDGTSKLQIAARLNIIRASVRRMLSSVRVQVASTRPRAA